MTVTEAARRLGVSRPALSAVLNGRAALSPRMAQRLARTFGADAAALLDRQTRHDAETAHRAPHPPVVPFAPSVTTIRAREITQWANSIEARQHLPVLLRRLVHGTGAGLSRVDFPGYDHAERRGWDGWVETSVPTAWIPEGQSGWEVSCSTDVAQKATRDFAQRQGLPDAERQQLTFVFVTPRHWPRKKEWESSNRRLRQWKDVRVYDASDLEQWIEQSVPVQIWLAERLGRPVQGLVSLDECWRRWADATDPPLPRALFMPTVHAHSDRFRRWLDHPAGKHFTIAADSRAEAVALVACLIDYVGIGHELSHRGIVFEKSAAVERLASSRTGSFVAIAATPEAEHAFRRFPRTLHTVIPVARNRVSSIPTDPDITLGLLGFRKFSSALAEMRITGDKARRLMRDSGRSPTVLRRCLSPRRAISTPSWTRSPRAGLLAPLSLVGAWNSASDADREAVSRLADCDYEGIEKFIAAELDSYDPPVWSVGQCRGVVSRLDSFFATVSSWTPLLLTRFFSEIRQVLLERNPALDLPETNQWMAPLYGKTRTHSDAIRNGLREGLVILSVHGPRPLNRRLGLNLRGFVDSTVRALMRPLDLDRLRSINTDLPDLAEAAPDVFLDAIEQDLASGDSTTMALMAPADSNILTGSCPRAGLLWALERLAWDPNHYSRAADALARLASVEIGDDWGNTPERSLAALFDPDYPQTMAPLSVRVSTLRTLASRHPEVGWRIAIGEHSIRQKRSLLLSHRPMWRGDAAAFDNAASPRDATHFIHVARRICLDWPRHNPRTLADLVAMFPRLTPDARRRVVRLIEKLDAPADTRVTLTERVRTVRRMLRHSHPALSADLEPLLDRLEGGDPIEREAWLFRSEWGPVHELIAEGESPHLKEAERLTQERRLRALRRIYADSGLDGIDRLTEATRSHRFVGSLLTEILDTPEARQSFVLRHLDGTEADSGDARADYLRYFLWDQESRVIFVLWREVVRPRGEPATLRFLKCLKYEHARVVLEEVPTRVRSAYWHDFTPNQGYSPREKNELVDRLLDVDRPDAVFAAVVANWNDIDSTRLVRLLRALGNAGYPSQELRQNSHGLFLPFKSLAGRPDVSDGERAELELMFFRVLRHSPYSMRSLAQYMASSPGLFVEAIARVSRREDGEKDPPQVQSGDDEEQRRVTRAAFDILEWFDRIPGTDDEGSVADEALMAWIRQARSMLRHLDRIKIGDQRIGRLLAKGPPGVSGIWPCRAICTALESVATRDVRIGFLAGSLDGRVWSRGLEDGGDQERDLAAQYAAWMQVVAPEFPFVASALRDIGLHYNRQADDEDTRADLRRRGVM